MLTSLMEGRGDAQGGRAIGSITPFVFIVSSDKKNYVN